MAGPWRVRGPSSSSLLSFLQPPPIIVVVVVVVFVKWMPYFLDKYF